MARVVRFDAPFAEITGAFGDLIYRKNKNGTITCYPKTKRNYLAHPVTEKESSQRKRFTRLSELATAIENDPAELAKYEIGYRVYCTVKQLSMHAYLMKVCSFLENNRKTDEQVTGKLENEEGGEL